MAVIGKLWAALCTTVQGDGMRILIAQALTRLETRGQGGARIATLLRALPLPVMALGIGGVLIATAFAPDATARVLMAVALLPEGVWWALATLGAALFGLRLQAREQAFAHEINAPLPPPVLDADSGGDAALSLSLVDTITCDNPALAICLSQMSQGQDAGGAITKI